MAGGARVPLANLPAGLQQEPVPDRNQKAGVFGGVKKAVRRDQAFLGVMPAQERFKADHAAGLDMDDRLIVNAELSLLERRAEIGFQTQAADGAAVHGFVKDFAARAAEDLGA